MKNKVMDFKFLENSKLGHLIPSKELQGRASFSITYSEDDIRKICKEYLNKKFNLDIDEGDFAFDIYDDCNDGKSTTGFYFELDDDVLSEEEIERLCEAGFESDNGHELLVSILEEEFLNPRFLNIEVYIEYPGESRIEVFLPLEHYDVLKAGMRKELTKEYIKNTLEEESLWKVGKSDTFCFGEWVCTLEKEDDVYAPFQYKVKAKKKESNETFARRYTSMEKAFLHILNRFNENANIRNRYSSLDGFLNEI